MGFPLCDFSQGFVCWVGKKYRLLRSIIANKQFFSLILYLWQYHKQATLLFSDLSRFLTILLQRYSLKTTWARLRNSIFRNHQPA